MVKHWRSRRENDVHQYSSENSRSWDENVSIISDGFYTIRLVSKMPSGHCGSILLNNFLALRFDPLSPKPQPEKVKG